MAEKQETSVKVTAIRQFRHNYGTVYPGQEITVDNRTAARLVHFKKVVRPDDKGSADKIKEATANHKRRMADKGRNPDGSPLTKGKASA